MSKNKGKKIKSYLTYHHSLDLINGDCAIEKRYLTEKEIYDLKNNLLDGVFFDYEIDFIKAMDGHINFYSVISQEYLQKLNDANIDAQVDNYIKQRQEEGSFEKD